MAVILDDISKGLASTLSIRLIVSIRQHLVTSVTSELRITYISLVKEGKLRREDKMVILFKLYIISRESLKFGSLLKSEIVICSAG